MDEEAALDPFLPPTASGRTRKPSNKAASQQRRAFEAKRAQKDAEKRRAAKAAERTKKATAKVARKAERAAQKTEEEAEKEERREARRLQRRANQSETLPRSSEFAMPSMSAEVSSEV